MAFFLGHRWLIVVFFLCLLKILVVFWPVINTLKAFIIALRHLPQALALHYSCWVAILVLAQYSHCYMQYLLCSTCYLCYMESTATFNCSKAQPLNLSKCWDQHSNIEFQASYEILVVVTVSRWTFEFCLSTRWSPNRQVSGC